MIDLLKYEAYMEMRVMKRGDKVYSAGDPSDGKLYIMLNGECLIMHLRHGLIVEKDRVEEGGFFGEMGVLHPGKRTATAVVQTSTAKVGAIARESFIKIGSQEPELFFVLLKRSIESLIQIEGAIKEAMERHGSTIL